MSKINVSLNDITKYIKSNRDNTFTDIRFNVDFMQSYTIPENLISQEITESKTVEHISKKVDKSFKFIDNELLEMPSNFSDFLDMNKYYIYGCKNLIESFIYIFNNDYKLENSSSKKQKLEEFYLNLLEKLNKLFSKNKDFFNEKKLKKSYIEKLIKRVFVEDVELENNEKMEICYAICNIYETNIVYLDITRNLYKTYGNNFDTNIIIIDYDGKLIPLIHIYGEFLSNDDIENILKYFKLKIDLKKITTYSLIELQEIAEKNNIDILINNKKKTKNQIYNDLSVLS